MVRNWRHLIQTISQGFFKKMFVYLCLVVLGLSCHMQALCWGKTALLLCGIRDLGPRPGIEPKSPVLKSGFLTTGPPAKSLSGIFDIKREKGKSVSNPQARCAVRKSPVIRVGNWILE